MKLARVRHHGLEVFAIAVQGGGWLPLALLGIEGTTTRQVIEALATVPDDQLRVDVTSAAHAHLAEHVLAEDAVELDSPVVEPTTVLAIGLNYRDHAAEANRELPEAPLVFAKLTNSLTGPFDDIYLDADLTNELDYEVELAVVIGRQIRGIGVDEAADAIFGYAVANDVSARDLQRGDGQWTRAKGQDSYCPIGPWITTADEIDDPRAITVSCHVDGELRQKAPVADLIFDIPTLVAHVSRGITLHPGDVILTGTPAGVGLGMTPPRYLEPGSVVRCEASGLGVIENMVVAVGEQAHGKS